MFPTNIQLYFTCQQQNSDPA